MWMMTKIGFYSIVRKPWDRAKRTLTVRTRVREDLEAFRDRCPAMTAIREDTKSDYRFRAQAPAKEVATTLAALLLHVDYDNFKNEVKQRDPIRSHLYAKVWDTLYDLQPRSAADVDGFDLTDQPHLFEDHPPRRRRRRKA